MRFLHSLFAWVHECFRDKVKLRFAFFARDKRLKFHQTREHIRHKTYTRIREVAWFGIGPFYRFIHCIGRLFIVRVVDLSSVSNVKGIINKLLRRKMYAHLAGYVTPGRYEIAAHCVNRLHTNMRMLIALTDMFAYELVCKRTNSERSRKNRGVRLAGFSPFIERCRWRLRDVSFSGKRAWSNCSNRYYLTQLVILKLSLSKYQTKFGHFFK